MSGIDDQPRIVSIETTGRHGSVAVAIGDQLLAMTRFPADRQHAVELLPAIDRLCAACNWSPEMIQEIHVSAGPGSFTGCRIGITAARALAIANSVRLVRVPTVDVLAMNALQLPAPPDHLVVLLDAQRRQVYAAVYQRKDKEYRRLGDVKNGDPDLLLGDLPRPCAVLGEGIAYHRRAVEDLGFEILSEDLWPARADNVLRIGRQLALQGQYIAANELVPIYIRLPEAEEKWRLRHNEAIC